MSPDLHPLFLTTPILPPDLLWFIIHSCTHPTTLIICSSQSEFLESLSDSVLYPAQPHFKQPNRRVKEAPGLESQDEEKIYDTQKRHALLAATPLYQIAIARHIRILFVPTVSHLRACLSIFDPEDSKVLPPPPPSTTTTTSVHKLAGEKDGKYGKDRPPLLLLYGFLAIHRHTSEWNVVGLNNTLSTLVETAKRVGFRAVLAEPLLSRRQCEGGSPSFRPDNDDNIKVEDEDDEVIRRNNEQRQDNEGEEEKQEQDMKTEYIIDGKRNDLDRDPLSENLVFMSASSAAMPESLTGTGWGRRTVTLRSVLGRWFEFREGRLDDGGLP